MPPRLVQQGPSPMQEFLRPERLGHEIVCAEVQGLLGYRGLRAYGNGLPGSSGEDITKDAKIDGKMLTKP